MYAKSRFIPIIIRDVTSQKTVTLGLSFSLNWKQILSHILWLLCPQTLIVVVMWGPYTHQGLVIIRLTELHAFPCRWMEINWISGRKHRTAVSACEMSRSIVCYLRTCKHSVNTITPWTYWSEVRICTIFVATGVNLGAKYRLMLFYKHGFVYRVLCMRAFMCLLVRISSVCKKFALFYRLSLAQAICKAVGTACTNYGLTYSSSSHWDFLTVWGPTSISWRALLHSVRVLHFDYISGSTPKWNFTSVIINKPKTEVLLAVLITILVEDWGWTTLKMETVTSSETFVPAYQTAWRYAPKD